MGLVKPVTSRVIQPPMVSFCPRNPRRLVARSPCGFRESQGSDGFQMVPTCWKISKSWWVHVDFPTHPLLPPSRRLPMLFLPFCHLCQSDVTWHLSCAKGETSHAANGFNKMVVRYNPPASGTSPARCSCWTWQSVGCSSWCSQSKVSKLRIIYNAGAG